MDEATKAELLDKYRDINVDFEDWSDYVVDQFKEDMRKIVDISNVYWSGFWSQGDGACFECYVSSEDWYALMTELGYDPDGSDRVFYEFMKTHGYIDVKHTGHYCHHKSVTFYDRVPKPQDYEDEDLIYFYAPYKCEVCDTKAASWVALMRNASVCALVRDVEEYLTDKMQELYRLLEKEYKYLTSDEAVWEAIVANELHLPPEERTE